MWGLPRPRVHSTTCPRVYCQESVPPQWSVLSGCLTAAFAADLAYAQALQYWVEKFRLPAHLDYCPLVMSIIELMWSVKEHFIFYKQDILWGLGRIAPEIVNQDAVVPWGTPLPNPPQLASEAQGQTLLKPGRHVAPLPCCLDLHLRRETPQSFQLNPKWSTGQLIKMPALLMP